MGSVEKITISLTPEMADFVRRAVDAGAYASTSEAIREAVREWKDRRDILDYTPQDLRALVEEGLASGPSSRTIGDVKLEARRRFEAARRTN
jgi:antitoxin ParD1/3/4